MMKQYIGKFKLVRGQGVGEAGAQETTNSGGPAVSGQEDFFLRL